MKLKHLTHLIHLIFPIYLRKVYMWQKARQNDQHAGAAQGTNPEGPGIYSILIFSS